jgi:homoserine kinase
VQGKGLRRDWQVRVPGSSANLGAAFDAVAVALDLHVEVSGEREGEPAPESHPAVRAFRRAGGAGPLHFAATFPGGRGLGYSGAARIAGLLAARVQHREDVSVADRRSELLREAAELEGHADNVAASLYGGVVTVAGARVVRVPVARVPAVVVWVPEHETPTQSARRVLPKRVAFADAVFNVGRSSLLVAALATGAVDALRTATEDRLHQERRLARVPGSRVAIETALEAGAWAAWLSGSGPSVAAFADPERAHDIAGALPATGRAHVLQIDDAGATIT